MTEEQNDHTDDLLRSTFIRLQSDAQEVDTMKAMRNLQKKSSRKSWLQPAVGIASVAVVATSGMLFYTLQNGDPEVSTNRANQPSISQTIQKENTDTEDTNTKGIAPTPSTTQNPSDQRDSTSSITESDGTTKNERKPAAQSPSGSSFSDLACREEVSTNPKAGEAIDHIFNVEQFKSATCLRTVFNFGKKGSTGAASGFLQELQESGDDHTNYLRFDLPSSWRTHPLDDGLYGEYENLNLRVADGFAAIVDETNPYLYIEQGSISTTSYTFLSEPARLIVDTEISATTPSIPNAKSGIYIRTLLDADDIGDCCVSISGFANQFEGVGQVELQTRDNTPVPANWRGKSVYGEDPSDQERSNTTSIGFRAGNAAWREFEFEVDGISAGEYKFVFSSGAVSPEEDPDSVLEVPFTVVTDV